MTESDGPQHEPAQHRPAQTRPAQTEALTDDPRPGDLQRAPSVVILNTGDGKGKSSAAFGVMIRGIARDWPVVVVQFVKSGTWHVGEETIGRRLGVEWRNVGDGFTWESENLEHDKALAQNGWTQAAGLIAAGEYRLVILDEITYLCTWGWIDTADVATAIRNRPANVNIVLTGRDAPQELVDVADTVTEMRKIKHAYDSGVNAMRGIEY